MSRKKKDFYRQQLEGSLANILKYSLEYIRLFIVRIPLWLRIKCLEFDYRTTFYMRLLTKRIFRKMRMIEYEVVILIIPRDKKCRK